jgi:hemoglobin
MADGTTIMGNPRTMSDDKIPSLYEWAGGMPAFEHLTEVFYQRVAGERLLAPLFARMEAEHPRFVAHFIAEVFGGPALYSQERGGHHAMIKKHLGKHLSEDQRKRWMGLLLECVDDCGFPNDPEFRSALVAYLEWGTRLAVINSKQDVLPDVATAMPKWDWGVPGKPYKG